MIELLECISCWHIEKYFIFYFKRTDERIWIDFYFPRYCKTAVPGKWIFILQTWKPVFKRLHRRFLFDKLILILQLTWTSDVKLLLYWKKFNLKRTVAIKPYYILFVCHYFSGKDSLCTPPPLYLLVVAASPLTIHWS